MSLTNTNIQLGCDIVYIPKLQKIIKRNHSNFLQRVFHENEMTDASIQHLAGIFAAKEAAIKALGLKAGDWLKLYIQHQKNGKPELHFINHNQVFPITISHDGDYALAVICNIKK